MPTKRRRISCPRFFPLDSRGTSRQLSFWCAGACPGEAKLSGGGAHEKWTAASEQITGSGWPQILARPRAAINERVVGRLTLLASRAIDGQLVTTVSMLHFAVCSGGTGTRRLWRCTDTQAAVVGVLWAVICYNENGMTVQT